MKTMKCNWKFLNEKGIIRNDIWIRDSTCEVYKGLKVFNVLTLNHVFRSPIYDKNFIHFGFEI